MIATLKKVWGIFAPEEQRKALVVLFLVVLMALLETAGVVSIIPFLTVLSRPAIVAENPWMTRLSAAMGVGSSRDFIVVLGLVSMALVIASSVFKAVTQHIINRFVHLERHAISVRLLAQYLHQPYEFFLTRNSAELNKNVLAEVDQVLFGLIHPIAQMLAQGAVVLAMAIVILAFDPVMALSILAVVGVLYALIYGAVRHRLKRIGAEMAEANRERYQACSEALAGIKDVKITHSADGYLSRFHRASRLYARHFAANDTLSQSPMYVVEAVGYSGLIVIALVLLLKTDDVARVMPALGLYGFAAYRMLPAAQTIYRGLARMRFSANALERLHADLTLPVDAESAPGPQPTLAPQREIRLDGIWFAYPSHADTPVLRDLSLAIAANTTVGIVGRSGAGKSTLMDVLLGLVQPQVGQFSIDGLAVAGAQGMAAWQRTIGYVPQHVFLADASVMENIAFGVPAQRIDRKAVERAARAAQIHDFVANELPQAYTTTVGDRGIRLSGGQRQRIGIARALYRDPPVLFFDEATSALDAQTEADLNESIRALSGRKTIIVIAHKAQSLLYCNQVLKVEDGRCQLIDGVTHAID